MVMQFLKRLLFRNMNPLTLPGDEKKPAAAEIVGPVVTYRIDIQKGQKTITCLRCGLTSWHYKDVEYLWCANCKNWHERRRFET